MTVKTNKDDAIYRYDKCEIKRAYYDNDGFLIVDAIVTRTGVFTYVNEDGTLRKELRHPNDIFKQASLKTMEMLPITFLHPVEKTVNADNSTRLSKGFTGQDVTIDGKHISIRLKVTDQETITAVENGIQELSLGYTVTLLDEAGEYDNEQYTHRQTECIYNHLAIVPEARAGAEARIKLDAAYFVQQIKTTNTIRIDGEKPSQSINHPTTKESRMKKFTIDSIEYDAAPEVVNFAKRQKERADAAEGKIVELQSKLDEATAKADTAEEKLKKAEAKTNDDAIKQAVDAHVKLVSIATPHLDEDTVKNIGNMTSGEIKNAVIKAHFPEAKLDGQSDAYIAARFDSAIELDAAETKRNKQNQNADADQRKKLNSDSGESKNTTVDQDKSRQDMINRLKNS